MSLWILKSQHIFEGVDLHLYFVWVLQKLLILGLTSADGLGVLCRVKIVNIISLFVYYDLYDNNI